METIAREDIALPDGYQEDRVGRRKSLAWFEEQQRGIPEDERKIMDDKEDKERLKAVFGSPCHVTILFACLGCTEAYYSHHR